MMTAKHGQVWRMKQKHAELAGNEFYTISIYMECAKEDDIIQYFDVYNGQRSYMPKGVFLSTYELTKHKNTFLNPIREFAMKCPDCSKMFKHKTRSEVPAWDRANCDKCEKEIGNESN